MGSDDPENLTPEQPEQPEQPPDEQPMPPDDQPEQPLEPARPPPLALSSFLSADEPHVEQLGEEEEEEEEEEEFEAAAGAEQRAEEAALAQPGRADVYQVLGDGKILELNQYRGLQVIDLGNPDQPVTLGHLPMLGQPVELHVAGDHAIAVVHHSNTYASTGEGLKVDALGGATSIMVADLADLTAPRLVSEIRLTGTVHTSRLQTRGGQPTLYVVFNESGPFQLPDGTFENRSAGVVQSFQIVAGALVERTRLVLGGSARTAHSTPDVLLVAHEAPHLSAAANQIALIDTSAADGSMAQRALVDVDTPARSMDLRDGTLRVFSGPGVGGFRSDLSVWDVADLGAPALVDRETFGDLRELHGSTLLADRAFAVTHDFGEPTGKLHTFTIDAAGNATLVGTIEVPNRTSLFRPVLGDTRLLGIGSNLPVGNLRLAVALYDATDPADPQPLLATADVSPAPSPSEDFSGATGDDRAFTVLENAVSVQAPTGELETGLVLVPFRTRWFEPGTGHQRFGVQMFTFSDTTLTRRGTMDHGTEPARSFVLGDGAVANLSAAFLSVFTPDLATPTQRGHVELVDDFVQIVPFGDYRIRVRNDLSSYSDGTEPSHLVEIIDRDQPVNSAVPLSSFAVPPDSRIIPMGNILVAVAERRTFEPDFRIDIVIETHDASDPRAPRKLGELISDQIPLFGDSPDRFIPPPDLHVLGNKLVFVGDGMHSVPAAASGTSCETVIQQDVPCAGKVGCTYPAGHQACFELDTGSYCTGGFAQCTYLGDGQSDCTPTDASELGDAVTSWCDQVEVSHRWRQLELDVVDLSNPAQPTHVSTIRTPENEYALGVVMAANHAYVTLKQPATVADDARPHARTFLRRIDLTDPAQPVTGDAIDVPGEVIAVQGAMVITRHRFWGEQFIETAVAQLLLTGDKARLLGYHHFDDRSIAELRVAQGLIVAKHDQVWSRPWFETPGSFDHTLTLLRLGGLPADGAPGTQGFQVLSEQALSTAPTLGDIIQGRLFLEVLGGRLMIDISNPVRPVFLGFLPLDHVSNASLYQDGKMFVPAGPNGIIEHDLTP